MATATASSPRTSNNYSGDGMAHEMDASTTMPPGAPTPGFDTKATDDVMFSDIGINVLLERLKKSVASARDFASFLKTRAKLESEHSLGLRKLGLHHLDTVQRAELRQGSYSRQLTEVCRAHERMADHGTQFALSLQRMQTDLTELTENIERGRKQWKQEGLNSEKKVQDAEALMNKAKQKYDSLAEEYDRARTGDKSTGKVFTVKGPKSAEKREDDLNRKLQSADHDYLTKVQAAQGARQENVSSHRPQAVKALQDLIKECDEALILQLQKFASFNERLIVGNGLVISPMKDPNTNGVGGPSSVRDMVKGIDNERDFHSDIGAHSSRIPRNPDPQYQRHPTLGGTLPRQGFPPQQQSQQQPQPQVIPPQAQPSQNTPSQQSPTTDPRLSQVQPLPQQSVQQQPPQLNVGSYQSPPGTLNPSGASGSPYNYRQAPQMQMTPERGFGDPQQQQYPQGQQYGALMNQQGYQSAGSPYGSRQTSGQYQSVAPNGYSSAPVQQQQQPTAPAAAAAAIVPQSMSPSSHGQAPTKPVFGVSLEELFRRDEHPIPFIVIQCMQAVNLFGLDLEGIYRVPGNQNHIQNLKFLFDTTDNDPGTNPRVDFRNPDAFYQDVNSVAGLLKQFFRDLPDPLLTSEHYNAFIEAARHEDDMARRDALHAVINDLPDPNYATLRALVLHLNRVQEHSQSNRMSTSNLALCFAPTLMGQHTGAQMVDAGLQTIVIDTILQNTHQIFDED